MTHKLRVLAAGTLAAAALALTAPIAKADGGPDTARIASSLPADQAASFARLTNAQQALTGRILADPDFAVPGRERALLAKYPEVSVTSTVTDATARTMAASGSRTSWVSQDWWILGITYAKITTTVVFSYNGNSATSVEVCHGNAVNYVPLRTINYYPTTSVNSDGTVTCRTNWTLDRPLQATAYGVQGLRVNGNGTIVRTYL